MLRLRTLITYVFMVCAFALTASAQVAAVGDMPSVAGITISGETRLSKDTAGQWLQMPLTLFGASLPRRHTLTVTPELSCDTATAAFPSVVFFGRWAYYAQVRSGIDDDSNDVHAYERHVHDKNFLYARAIPFEPWMENATLTLHCSEADTCGHVIRSWQQPMPAPQQTPAATPQPTYSNFRTFRPLFAIKSNALFDLALTPNIEVEVPLGRDKRWSLMAEVWCPWYRFGHNSSGESNPYRRSDQRPTRHAYQLLNIGVEARYWFAPRRNCARPTLCGGFLGIYGSGGKYDMEFDSEGYQGEFTSIGISGGYSWPISRHWNLELSAAVGYVGGPRVHYGGEFDDTRLIYRDNKTWHYFGPTKLKVSLVWVIGKKIERLGH